jgi:hypothetical protein
MMYKDQFYTKTYINQNKKKLYNIWGRTGIDFILTWQTAAQLLRSARAEHH